MRQSWAYLLISEPRVEPPGTAASRYVVNLEGYRALQVAKEADLAHGGDVTGEAVQHPGVTAVVRRKQADDGPRVGVRMHS